MKHLVRETDGNRETDQKKGISVTWKNLSVIAEHRKASIFRKTQKSYKRIIHNVTGAIFPNNLVAVLGASGSGKTTLLSALANRIAGGLQIQGDIRIDGKSSKEFLKQVSGYVYQDDFFIPELTVMQHLNFTAKLRLDRNIKEGDRKQMILKVLREVGLLELANVSIGDSNYEGKMTLSGGERKRLSVATELLTGSRLLFCDEPTTGLDSYSSYKLMSIMQNMVIESNRTIVCAIHQPNMQIFQLFKQIILLSDGHIVFNGSTANAIQFFQGQGYRYNFEQNPAEYFISSIAIKREKENERSSESTLHDDYLKSEYFESVQNYVNNCMKQPDVAKFTLNAANSRTWFSKLIIFIHRNFLTTMKLSSCHTIRLSVTILLATLIGLFLHGTVKKTQLGIKAIKTGIYFIIVGNFFTPLTVTLSHIPNQMPLFYREYSNNSTSPCIFYLSNILALLPNFVLEPLCWSLIISFLTGLCTTCYALMITLTVSILLFNGSAVLGIILSMLCSNSSIAATYGNDIMYVFYTSSGLLLKLSSIPYCLQWIQYISVVTYATSALFVVQFENLYDIECETNSNVPCFRTGLEVLKSFDFDKDTSLYNDIMVMLLLYFVFHIIAFLCFLHRIKNRIM